MSLRSYIILMLITTVACYLAFLAIIYFFEPSENNVLVLILFYTSAFLCLIGTFSLLGLVLRVFFTSDQLIFRKVITSFRQSIWFALLIIIGLYLKNKDLLVWRNIILLILALALLELFFMSYKAKPSKKI
jgi:hypothetical protein